VSRLSQTLARAWISVSAIRVRLTIWYVVLLGVILLVFSGFLYLSLYTSLHAEVDRSLVADAQRDIASLDYDNGGLSLANADYQQVGTVTALYDRSGQRVLANDPRQPLPVLAGALAAAARGQQALVTTRLQDGANWRVLTTPIVANGVLVGVLQVGRSERDVDAALYQLAVLIAVAIPLTLVFASAGGLFLASRALGPIDRITRAAAAIDAEDLSRRLDFGGSRDEVGRLAATFDRMLDRLDAAFRRQRQFTADASHELRTPLTVLASQIDVALERPRTPEEYQRLLASLRDDTARMGQLLGELLTLARADAGQQLLSREPLELAELVHNVVSAMQPLAGQRGVQLVEDTRVEAVVDGDQTRLSQLLLNLVENGLRYTPAGGSVSVRVGHDGGWAVIEVADTGVGIAREHLPHVFERFYRADPARARSDGGAGLGLAIGHWIAQAHGGRIEVSSEPGRGSTFRVYLPSAAGQNQRTGAAARA
jgi:heavy metal sensor kinase